MQKLLKKTKQRTRAGCNSSAEVQGEVEDKAEQAHDAAPEPEAAIVKSPKKLLTRC